MKQLGCSILSGVFLQSDLIIHSGVVVHFSLKKNSQNRMDSFCRLLGMWDLEANIEVGWSEMSLS